MTTDLHQTLKPLLDAADRHERDHACEDRYAPRDADWVSVRLGDLRALRELIE